MKSNSKLKVIFMGGNLLGCTCLRYLVRAKNIKVLLVVGCYQDNGSVVEPKVWNASIARVALNKNLPFIQPKSTKNLQFINEIQKLDRPDLIITVEYDKILDPLILGIPRLGGINLHFSPLPRHRGAFPVMWSLMEDQRAGISLHWINEQVNGGDLIAQQTIAIGANDTSYSLYLKLSKIGMELFKNHFPKIMRGTASRQPQSEAEATYHPAGYPEQRMINWNNPSAMIDRFVRALTFPGFEAARTFYNDMEINVLHPVEMVAVPHRDLSQPPGTILNIMPEGIMVKTGDAALIIKKIRINQSMPIDAYKLGKLFSLKAGDSFRSFERLSIESQLNLIVP